LAAASRGAISSFVAGDENRLVAAAFQRLLDWVSQPQSIAAPPVASPLLLIGPTGSGKTHLAHGLAEVAHAKLGSDRVAYLTASDFSRQVSSAVADRSIADVRRQLRRSRLLVIDDLPRLAGNAYALEELTHTLQSLEASGGLLLATSTHPLTESPQFGRGFIARMLAGVTLRISPHQQPARRELTRLALEALGVQATPAAAAVLAQSVPGQPPRVFQLALKVRQRVQAGVTIDEELAASLLQSGVARRSPPADLIVEKVTKYYGLPAGSLATSSRKQTTVLARAVAIYLMRELTPLSYDQIGRLLGGRDHTTVMHNYRRVEKGLTTDRALADAVAELRSSTNAECEG
ncbi:MAG: ATP-binding protein, partial [Planctomycetales bacterium]|nr:ATP-binding protein [Planctomycetales bacterium]